MGDFAKWLVHENQKELFDYLFAIVLNAVFLALTALLLWPLGKATTDRQYTVNCQLPETLQTRLTYQPIAVNLYVPHEKT